MKLLLLPLALGLGVHCASPAPGDADPEPGAPTSAPAPDSVLLCGRTWATKNLDVTRYRNGDPIPHVPDSLAWQELTTGAWCWYANDSAAYAHYGRLYNWYAVNDPRGLAPEGWHVLTDAEWDSLGRCLSGAAAAYRLKEPGTAHWKSPVPMADGSSGFNALPAGLRSAQGAFSGIGSSAVFWTASAGSISDAWCGRVLYHVNNRGVGSMVTGMGYMDQAEGYSVRCVRDR